uniref:Transposase (Or an inactivated derivative) n=1 Tax=Candidatus Kentrum sp. DK TaxID=2126562 RepID=A0A450TPF6_9GAMM|nr:MAG: Transposase (or an inactivated derivative) [Candidatus Kentron sp. DK]
MKNISRTALFRLSVLGALVSRERLDRGELKDELERLAVRDYDVPNSSRTRLSVKTIESWYYAYRKQGIQGLEPNPRSDRGRSKLSPKLQALLLAAKRENPRRSIRVLKRLMEEEGHAGKGKLSRSAIHRLLQRHGLSNSAGLDSPKEEFRRFQAPYAGDIWYGDVMHGPRITVDGRGRKIYLVTVMDDASRLVAHSAFCLGETALDIERVLKQALLKRGRPRKLVVDNGAAYRAVSLQGICARLKIHLVYCRPYAPEGKGKLERWHRTVRGQFLTEVDFKNLSLDDVNARLWAWIEQSYHRNAHDGLGGLTPLARYQQDLSRIRSLGEYAATIDQLFYHRQSRKVRKDGTVSYGGRVYEVPYELSSQTIHVLVDPHCEAVVGIEDREGGSLGPVTELDPVANSRRPRIKPNNDTLPEPAPVTGLNPVESAYRRYYGDSNEE